MSLAKAQARDYSIRYKDQDQEMINVSDDEDLITAYEVAESDLNGNLRFVIEFKKPFEVDDCASAPEEKRTEEPKKPKEEEKVLKSAKTLKTKEKNKVKGKAKKPALEEEEKSIPLKEEENTSFQIVDESPDEMEKADTMKQPQFHKTFAEQHSDETLSCTSEDEHEHKEENKLETVK